MDSNVLYKLASGEVLVYIKSEIPNDSIPRPKEPEADIHILFPLFNFLLRLIELVPVRV